MYANVVFNAVTLAMPVAAGGDTAEWSKVGRTRAAETRGMMKKQHIMEVPQLDDILRLLNIAGSGKRSIGMVVTVALIFHQYSWVRMQPLPQETAHNIFGFRAVPSA